MTAFSGENTDYELAGDDVVVPYSVDALDVRGRAVQLGPMLDTILKRHNYPEAVSFLLGELIVLTVLLGSSLKFQGNFILQTQTDGPVSLVVVDFSTPGSVRAYARFDEAQVSALVDEGKRSSNDLLGDGVLAMTIDQGADMQRYQGIVSLSGISLEDAAHDYFRQSEQIPTKVKLAVGQVMLPTASGTATSTSWRGGGIITQFFPDSESRIRVRDLPSGAPDEEDMEVAEDDAWTEAVALMDTVGADELTDPQIHAERLLYRLFNQRGVRVFDGTSVEEHCSCSREKVLALVKQFDEKDTPSDKPKEAVTTKCEFCSTVYVIEPEELEE